MKCFIDGGANLGQAYDLGLRKQDLLDGLFEKNIKHYEWH